MSSFQRLSSEGPAFGRAEPSNCEREKIHLPGSIQPHGALLVVDCSASKADELKIVRASQNASEFLGLASSLMVIDTPLAKINPSLANTLFTLHQTQSDILPFTDRSHETLKLDSAEDQFVDQGLPSNEDAGKPIGRGALDCVAHYASEHELVLEFEPGCELPETQSEELQQYTELVSGAASLQSLCDTTVNLFSKLLGYDRVMIYRFASDGHGQVIAEQCVEGLDTLLGNHYPATDIPQIARELYKLNRVRVLPDVAYKPVALRPKPGVGTPETLDMSRCHLRSMSPMHTEYLSNMGVAATLVTSLVVGGKLWGLITCNHMTPRLIGYRARTIAELMAEIVATRISALDSLEKARNELLVQKIEKNMIEAISREGDWTKALFDRSGTLLQPLDATGSALVTREETHTIGKVPGENDLHQLIDWLDSQDEFDVFSTQSLTKSTPQFGYLAESCAGLVAAPVSSAKSEYLLWFRPEHLQSITWGGDPRKLNQYDDASGELLDLTPRKSFEKWTEELKGTSREWNETEISAARLVAASVADVMQQFRAMRVMIAHNQLESLTEQIVDSDLPALIADATGHVLLKNQGFDRMLWNRDMKLEHITDLPRLFSEQAFAQHNLVELLQNAKAWRGGATLDSKPVLVRADPVFSAPEKVLGFVVLLTDISDRQLAENAKKRFPQHSFSGLNQNNAESDNESDAAYDNLIALVIENAQIAAMEITEGIDAQRIPMMLQSVENSVSRTSDLINSLLAYSKDR